jgi:phosphoribulokinase
MSEVLFSYPFIIGIAGAARAGKDTLCRALIREFAKKNILATRKSIAGDTVKGDLQELIEMKFNLNSFTEVTEQKEFMRPLLVEYGKMQRAKTQGRYFIEQFEPEQNAINILPDIRYVEYPKDEVFWLKNEMNGFLIFVERRGIYDANDTERVNNFIIKQMADYIVSWDSLDEQSSNHREIINDFALKVIEKASTTYQRDN